MAKSKEQKAQIIENIKKNLERARSLVFTDYQGLKMADLQELRKSIKDKGKFEITKINLAKLAFGGKKEFDDIVGKNALAIAYSFKDEISVPKEIKKFTKINENLKILGGFYEGKFLNKREIERLIEIPSKEELMAKLIMIIQEPIYGLHGTLNNFTPRLVRVLKAIGEGE